MTELTIKDFKKNTPHVPNDIKPACIVLFKMSTCHWCHQEQEVFDKLNKEIGFMKFHTFTVDSCQQNQQHWQKIKKSLTNKQLDGFPIIMLYSGDRVEAFVGFEDYDQLKQKLIDFAK